MKKQVLVLTLLWLCVSSFIYGQKQPAAMPFMPEVFSRVPNVRDFTISPAKDEIYFTVESFKKEISFIAVIKKEGSKWSKPQTASFSGSFNDLEAFFSADGNRLFFSSRRPLLTTDTVAKKDFDIWYVERKAKDSAWSAPLNLGAPINSGENEFYPCITSSGNLYFTAQRADSKGKEDIYLSRFKNGKYELPISLDSVNTEKYEFNAYISPDESFMLFTSYGRPTDLGGGDLYCSVKDKQGNWKKGVHLGLPVNSDKIDYCPYPDMASGMLYFTSERSSIRENQRHTGKDYLSLLKLFYDYSNGQERIYTVDMKSIKPLLPLLKK